MKSPAFSKNTLWLVLIIAICAISYAPSLRFDFTHLDDQEQVVHNTSIQELNFSKLKRIFSETSVGMYQPVSTLTYALAYKLGGSSSLPFHLLSLLVHLINITLVFHLFKRFDFSNALRIGLVSIFAFHPMQVESIVWISAFSTLLFTSFYLLTLHFYFSYLDNKNKTFLIYCFAFFLLASLSKSMAISLPLVMLAVDYWKNDVLKWKQILQKIPFFLCSLAFGIVTIWSRETVGHLSDLSQGFNLFERYLLTSYSFLFYPFKFLYPSQLSVFYPFPEKISEILPWRFYASGFLMPAVAFLLFKHRNQKLLVLGSLFYLFCILLVVQIIAVGNQLTSDRYIYLPSVALLLILGYYLNKWKVKNLPIVFALIGIFLAFSSFQRAKIWKNDETIWTDVLEKYPKVPQAYNNLGSYQLSQNQEKAALNSFNMAIQLKPNYSDAYSNRGSVYSQMGNTTQALKDFEAALALKPNADAYFNRGNEFARLNQPDKAISDYSKSIALKPSADAFTNRGLVYARLKNAINAESDFKKALKIDGNYAQAHLLLGVLYQTQNKSNLACSEFKIAFELGMEQAQELIHKNCQ